jgi:hypothetical protein
MVPTDLQLGDVLDENARLRDAGNDRTLGGSDFADGRLCVGIGDDAVRNAVASHVIERVQPDLIDSRSERTVAFFPDEIVSPSNQATNMVAIDMTNEQPIDGEGVVTSKPTLGSELRQPRAQALRIRGRWTAVDNGDHAIPEENEAVAFAGLQSFDVH